MAQVRRLEAMAASAANLGLAQWLASSADRLRRLEGRHGLGRFALPFLRN